ncbi:MAG: long-chain fatty acid--CoA ligase, partial [Betaproteobacteria bacterium]|nr:long-chain fatty acid--CoA ligase [Betaproteobacteria bacterium]
MIDTEMTPKPWPAVSLSEANRMLTASGMPLEIEEREIRGVLLKVWKHAPGNLREVFLQGRKHGSKTFLVHEDERIDFESFSRASIHVAHHLKQLGVSRGDRVALAMRNLPQWPVCFFASLLIGAIVVPLNAWWTGRELHYALEDSGSKLLFVDAERFERIAP